MKNKIVCGLDIGTSKIAGCLYAGSKDKKRTNLLFTSGNVRGLNRGIINDISLFCASAEVVLNKLQKDSGANFKEVHVSIQGDHISCRHSSAALPLSERGSGPINASDIKKINEQARILGLRMDETLLYSFPSYYLVDDTVRSKNPLGLYGHKLEVDLYLATTQVNLTDNIAKALNNLGYNVKGFHLSASATGRSVLSDKEREIGVMLMDIGAGITEVAIFKDGRMRHLEVFGFGAGDFTRAIAEEFNIGLELAEDIKKSCGSVSSERLDDTQEVMISRGNSYFPVKRRDICSVLTKKSENMLKAMENKLSYTLNKDGLSCGIVAVGGGVHLDGLLESLEHTFSRSVKIGGLRESKDIGYATSLGIVQSVIKPTRHIPDEPCSIGGILNRISGKFKEVYREYF